MIEFLQRISGWSDYAKSLLDQLAIGRPLTNSQKISVRNMAAKLGRKTGRCQCCGRILTDEQSIKDGIGPICKGKFE